MIYIYILHQLLCTLINILSFKDFQEFQSFHGRGALNFDINITWMHPLYS